MFGLVKPVKLISRVVLAAVFTPIIFAVGVPLIKQVQSQYGNLPIFIGGVILIVIIAMRIEFTRTVLAGIAANFLYDNIRILLIITGVMGASATLIYSLSK